MHLWPPCRCGLGQPGPAGPPRCRRSSESQVPPGSAWPGRGVSAQLSDSWPNHVNYLFGFFQSISCCVPQGGSGVKGAGRKGSPRGGSEDQEEGKAAGPGGRGLAVCGWTKPYWPGRGGTRDPGFWKGVEEQAREMVSLPWGWASGLRPPRKQTGLFPGGLQATARVLCGPVALVPDTESASATRCCRSQPVSHLRRTVQRRRVCRLN